MNDSYPAPLPPPSNAAELPKAVIEAYSDINALFAFCVRRSNEVNLFNSCEGMPYAGAKLCEETGIEFGNNSPHLLALLDDYFRIKAQEKEAHEKASLNEK